MRVRKALSAIHGMMECQIFLTNESETRNQKAKGKYQMAKVGFGSVIMKIEKISVARQLRLFAL